MGHQADPGKREKNRQTNRKTDKQTNIPTNLFQLTVLSVLQDGVCTTDRGKVHETLPLSGVTRTRTNEVGTLYTLYILYTM